jgi:RNA ligase (TIGR02306 family)
LQACLDASPGCKTVQIFGEVLPVQGGNWTYGLDPNKPEIRIFDARVDGKSSHSLRDMLMDLWVPIIIVAEHGSIKDCLHEFCAGMECVSGKSLRIREGIVMRPVVDRYASDGTRLMVKIINPAYAKKETGEEIS